jgi:dihydroorotate dehydrogenase
MNDKPTYHFDQSYRWNYEHGPDFHGEFPDIQNHQQVELLGMKLHSPYGISAGILLNSRWIETYAKLGFDILTYKTVRSAKRECYPLPNWVFVDCPEPLREGDDAPLVASLYPKENIETLTSSVCFGMPSTPPAIWREDVANAKCCLSEGQMLIVSVVGTPTENGGIKELADDYAQCAAWAADAGADAIEANLSCPNVCTAEGAVYHSEESTRIIGERIKEVIGDKPLLLKISSLHDQSAYEQFLQLTQPFADGIVLLNCVSRQVHDEFGKPIFGEGKERAGVLGWGTFDICYKHARLILQARERTGCKQAIIPVGGAVTPDSAKQYLQAGADAVLMGGAPVFDPYLATKLKSE